MTNPKAIVTTRIHGTRPEPAPGDTLTLHSLALRVVKVTTRPQDAADRLTWGSYLKPDDTMEVIELEPIEDGKR
jgi:hypothetical protein